MIKKSWMVMAALLLPALGWAQDRNSDEIAIKQRLATYSQARERGDVHAEAQSYAMNADFRAFGGALAQGRDAIEKTLVVSNPNYHFALTVEHVNFLDANIAVAETTVLAGPKDNQRPMVATYTMVKQRGNWLIGAARVAAAAPPPEATPAPSR
jgi:uncharacterized protein (TIGR02246 family)